MSAPSEPVFSLDQDAVVRAFNRAGPGYEAAAWLQRHARSELIERLQYFSIQPGWVLDLGAGTCQACRALARRYARARVLAIDLAPAMLSAAPRQLWRQRFARACADAHALPLADERIDLIYSNLMLQWCDRPEVLFAELSRVLRPSGLLVFSSFGPDSLRELRAAWAAADSGIHVSEFPDMPQLGDALLQAGFVEPVLDAEQHRRYYPDVYALMRELKRVGAHNAASTRARGLTARARMRAMSEAYEHLRTPAGLPATYQLIFGAAFRGERPRARAAAPPGEYAVPIDTLRRRQR